MYKFQQTRKALGCQAVLTLVGKDQRELDKVMNELWRTIDEFDLRFSRFITFSELSNFNLNAGKLTKLSPEFLKLLTTAKQYSKKTRWQYNPFILPALQRAGYKGSWPNTANVLPELDFSHRQIAHPSKIYIEKDKARIPENTALDFGGIGKGYLLDQLADLIESRVNGYWLSLGGDIIVGGKDENQKNWVIGIEAAEGKNAIANEIVDSNRLAIATSGTTKRNGIFHNKSWHHLIDPVSGEPSRTDISTATVIARSATDADILASCIVLKGSGGADELANAFFKSAEDYNIILQLGVMTSRSRSVIKLEHSAHKSRLVKG